MERSRLAVRGLGPAVFADLADLVVLLALVVLPDGSPDLSVLSALAVPESSSGSGSTSVT